MTRPFGVFALLLALTACSNRNPPSTGVPSFADLDTDGDKLLSQRETFQVPALANIFSVADADRDGRLSVAEFSQATIEGTTVSREAASGPLFSAVDRDGDGAITVAEAQAVPEVRENFASFDANSNGELSSDEYRHVVEQEISED